MLSFLEKTICRARLGNLGILDSRLLGFFCSTQCSGDAILRPYDLAQALRGAGIPLIGGFHSPMEKECLDLLLRGQQSIVIWPARSLQGLLDYRTRVHVIDLPDNAHLIENGALPIQHDHIRTMAKRFKGGVT